MQEKYKQWQKMKAPKIIKKITLKELKAMRNNSVFAKHAGTTKDLWPGLSSVEVAKKWTDYVD